MLVERVEGFCSEDDWKRAYREINDFERQLRHGGILLAKFWLQVSKDEQLRRFEERGATPRKQWKLTDEDWRNREKWPAYKHAVHDMVSRTSSAIAPWHLIPANDKRYARLEVVRTINAALEEALV